MSDYNFELDMDSYNSLSIILKQLEPNKDTLECGPAFGRATKYLKEQLNHNVWIVEKDMKAGTSASEFAEEALIGGEAGDLEKYHWVIFAEQKEKKFDYIIFADVLEHLFDPFSVLENAKQFLKENGSVWVCVPNIGYIGALVDLWNNDFEYRDTGIQDINHIRFFAYNSLVKYIKNLGYDISSEHHAINAFQYSEYAKENVNFPESLHDELAKRPYNNVYQFIFELKPSK